MTSVAEIVMDKETEYLGTYENGVIRLAAKVDWAEGTQVNIRMAETSETTMSDEFGKVIIAGFGLAGRWIADIFERHDIDYVIIEKNSETIATQRKLGHRVIEGNVADEATLRAAGVEDASILALTVPDEEAVLEATRLARQMKPGIYIVARTLYSSSGMKATQLGANDVVKGEQVVARQLYEMMLRKICGPAHPAAHV